MATPRRKKLPRIEQERVSLSARYPDLGVNGGATTDGVSAVFTALARLVAPPEKVDPITWLEQHRRLSPEASAEPGPFSFSRVPYAIEPQRAILDPSVPEVVLCWASQCGKTEVASLNPVLYWSVVAPGPCLIVTPDWKSAQSLSCDRLDPMLRDARVAGVSLAEERSGGPGSDSSMFRKTIGAGMGVTIVNASSASQLAQRPIRYLLFEEVSRLPQEARGRGLEGDVVQLAKVRTSTFGKDAKVIYSSSPIERDVCRVSALYEASTRERYHCRCPRGHLQILVLAQMDFKTATCKCLKCGRSYSQQDWQEQPGKWIAENPLMMVRRGFWMNVWPSPFLEWATIYEEWRAAIHLKDEGDWSLYRSICGTRLAEALVKPVETMTNREKLMNRREVYPERLDDRIKVIVAAADTQDSWVDFLVVGFGPRRECWALASGQILGRLDLDGREMYEELFRLTLHRYWLRQDGKAMRVTRMLQDAGGHMAPHVFRGIVGKFPRVIASRAVQISGLFRFSKSEEYRERKLILGNTSSAKELLSGMLGVESPGPGYVHFPINADGTDAEGFTEEFFKQLESEKREIVVERGLRHVRWTQVRDRNEALDCFALALIGLESLRLSLTEEMAPIIWKGYSPPPQDAEEPSEASPLSPSPSAPPVALITKAEEEQPPRRRLRPRKVWGNPWGTGWRTGGMW